MIPPASALPIGDVAAPEMERLRVLLVEDNPGDAVLVREMLRTALDGHVDVVHLEALSEARRQVRELDAACVLLDLSLPDAVGLEAVTQMQAAAPDIPIVVLSGIEDESLALRAVAHGAQDYLIKGRVDEVLISRSIRYAIERKRAEVALAHQALHDPLTGLPNRALFLDRLEQALARARRSPVGIAVLFLDLDRFKVVNDSLGHEAGDRLLVDVAHRLRDVVRPGDTVARFGGDEFTILCDVRGEHDAVLIAERVAAAVEAPFTLDDNEAFLTASLGIALTTEHEAARGEALIRDADAAMYRAKERGKSRYELFDSAMRARAVERLAVENELHRALDRGEFRVFYQPAVDLQTRETVGVEALVRWQHPERGLVGPDQFIALTEETGLIVPLGAWVLREACRQWRQWEQSGIRIPRISVNLSTRQLGQPDLVDAVVDVLEETGMDPGQLWLEITESTVLEDTESALVTLEALKGKGVRISLDDFGTGYSSLALLKRLPVDELKVDRSFVMGLGRDPQDSPIVSTVIGLAEALGLAAIAEGVETAAQADELLRIGCRFAQGYYFARPQPPERMTALLRSGLDIGDDGGA
ncbi:MAG TPA: EAL domain-containing protein [Solirubrobacteraceae bacterium]|nr:EAL domain-containing protein [Solirubrobacteraceae bacterium]